LGTFLKLKSQNFESSNDFIFPISEPDLKFIQVLHGVGKPHLMPSKRLASGFDVWTDILLASNHKIDF